MNTNWSKILLFSLLFAGVGFLIGRACGGHRHGCHGKRAHHAACCGDGVCGGHGNHGKGGDGVHAIVKGLTDAGFEGDTVIVAHGATINVSRRDGKLEVKVEKRDGGEEVEVGEVH